jgi:predicted permease
MNFLTSLISVGLLVALAAPGYILRKLKMLPDDFTSGLVTVLLYVSSPFLTISAFMQVAFSRVLLRNMVVVGVLGFVFLIGAFGVSRLCFAWGKDTAARKVCVAGGFLCNASFMGIPVMQAFFPGNPLAILYVSMFSVSMNIISWTLLVSTITGNRKYVSVKAALINPGTVSFLIALGVQVVRIPIGGPVANAVQFLANTTTPLSMLVMGQRLADIRFGDLFRSPAVYLSMAVKLILVPMVTLGVLLLLRQVIPADPMAYKTLFILSAMPSASYVLVFSEKFNADRTTAAKCVLLSSVLSILTIPVMMLLITALG